MSLLTKDIVLAAISGTSIEMYEYDKDKGVFVIMTAWEVFKEFNVHDPSSLGLFFEFINKENKGYYKWLGECDLKKKYKESIKNIKEMLEL